MHGTPGIQIIIIIASDTNHRVGRLLVGMAHADIPYHIIVANKIKAKELQQAI